MDLSMRIKLLPAPFIIKGFVHGEEKCNYEIYLLELLNSSIWFNKKYPEGFHKPESEAHGECDAINDKYEIDFKLFASKTALQAKSELSSQISIDADGVAYYGQGKKSIRKKSIVNKPDGEIGATRLVAAMRGKTYGSLCSIRAKDIKKQGVDNDIITALKTLETKKNLLLFFPYEFTFDKQLGWDVAIKNIAEALNKDFGAIFEYRNKKTENNFDTFLTCIYKESFLIFMVIENRLCICDFVKTNRIKTFSKLSNYTNWW